VPSFIPEVAAIQEEALCLITVTFPVTDDRVPVSPVGSADVVAVGVGIAVGVGVCLPELSFFPQPIAGIITAITRITESHLNTFAYSMYNLLLYIKRK
jgi:hypothetical protein